MKNKEELIINDTSKIIEATIKNTLNENIDKSEIFNKKMLKIEKIKDRISDYVRIYKDKDSNKLYNAFNGSSDDSKVGVFKVKHRNVGLIRKLTKCSTSSEYLEPIKYSSQIQMNLAHPNILKIFEIFDTKISYDVISEVSDGRKLFEEILDIGPLSEKITANIIYQLLSVVNYLHTNKKIIHSRINPNSIIVNTYDDDNEYYDIKLANYQYAILDDKDKEKTGKLFSNKDNKSNWKNHGGLSSQASYFNTSIIDKFFVAPETIKSIEYDCKIDIYSIGILAYYMLTGIIPYSEYRNPMKYILNDIKNEFTNQSFLNILPEGKNLIKSMIERNPNKRISASKALESKWFIILETKKSFKVTDKDYINICKNLQKYNPTNKLEELALSFLIHNIPDINDVRTINNLYLKFNTTNDAKLNSDQAKIGFETYSVSKTSTTNKKKFDEVIDNIFDKSNKDKYISYEEFVKPCINLKLFTDDVVLKFVYDFIDKNLKGNLTYQELKEIYFKYDLDSDDILQNIHNDINEEKFINFDSFKNMMLKFIQN